MAIYKGKVHTPKKKEAEKPVVAEKPDKPVEAPKPKTDK